MAALKKFLSLEMVSLIMAFAILALAGLVTIRTDEYRRNAGALVRHTLFVESALQRLYATILREESDERGYLLTRDKKFINSNGDISGVAEQELTGLAHLVSDNPEQVKRVDQIRPILEERLGLLKRKLDLMKDGRFDEAAEIVRGGRGKALMDQIDGLIAAMIMYEETRYRQRDDALRRANDNLQSAIVFMTFGVAAVAGFAIFLTHKQMNALRTSSESLKSAYNRLLEESTRRETLEAQLRQSQKLEALGQLTGGIAHDFNNMLAVIVASLNILRRKLDRKEDGGEQMIDSALQSADSAAGLVRRLLAFSRIQPLAPTPLDANKFVSDISKMLKRALGENIRLETVLADGLWSTRIDANELESALLNLAVNARDAMPNGGTLTIETANRALDDAYAAENVDVKTGDYVLVSVTDTGEGMSPEIVAKVFDPFFTTKPAGKGTGLGLSQVHGFVKQSGGHIKIVSEPERGTTIKLYFPRHLGDAAAERPSAIPAQVNGDPIDFLLGQPSEVILVVEDDETARRVTVEGMRELGYTAIEAGSGQAALDILETRPDVTLMITDVTMSGMDGVALAKEALKRRPKLRVLHISGYMPNTLGNDGLLNKDINLLSKPFTLEQIARRIRETIDAV
ncbi:CHASE3 domain-containing protein [Methylocystis sp. ATCC 49242]|uniref:CHASE3 domain-containing protein n=1 Tax=Methylocystis sp. ATCC 49242 TaxID=622637 RepID=UPI0001F86A1A|nr:CHASE3 domain-containing protein [Methylocystis sp. ATCC 49242]